MSKAELRACPECGGAWPKGPEFALRGCGWIHGLPRDSSPTNVDGLFHDGEGGRNRFLVVEFKQRDEPWSGRGQLRSLAAMAGLPNFTVRVLRGSTRRLDVHRVGPKGLEEKPVAVTFAEAVRRAIAGWLDGASWALLERSLAAPVESPGHLCGWARVDGVWTCVQDAKAVGFEPETACGRTAPEYP
jgi:hypothetical protein